MVSTGHRDDYKHSKEAFVSGTTGSTVSHINVIALVAPSCVCILSFYMLHFYLRWNYKASIALHSPSAHAHHHRTPFCFFRMATPRCSSSPLNDPFRASPRGTIRRPNSSDRPPRSYAPFSRHTSLVHLYLQAASSLPVHHRTARRIHTTTSPPTEGGVGRGARDDAFVRVEHLVPRAYDARNGARDPCS
jgi:hypothetical protein